MQVRYMLLAPYEILHQSVQVFRHTLIYFCSSFVQMHFPLLARMVVAQSHMCGRHFGRWDVPDISDNEITMNSTYH